MWAQMFLFYLKDYNYYITSFKRSKYTSIFDVILLILIFGFRHVQNLYLFKIWSSSHKNKKQANCIEYHIFHNKFHWVLNEIQW